MSTLLTESMRGLTPSYADEATGVLVYGQPCTRPDGTVDLSRCRHHAPNASLLSSPARLRGREVLINSLGRGTLGRVAHMPAPDKPVVADGNITILRVSDEHSSRYLFHALTGHQDYEFFNEVLGRGATNQTSFTLGSLRRALVPVPDLVVQRSVARYLDEQTSDIRAITDEFSAQLQLLAQREQAAVSAAVDVADKEVVAVGKLKWFTTIARGRFTHRPRNDPALYGGPYPFIQTGDIAGAPNGVVEDATQTLNERGLAVSRLATAGTLVMSIAANIGDVATLGFDACFPDSIVSIEAGPLLNAAYLAELLRANREELLSRATMNTQLNLNVERIGDVVIRVPTLAAQHRAVTALGDIRASVRTLTTEIETQMALVAERRAVLVSSAVSGHLEVHA